MTELSKFCQDARDQMVMEQFCAGWDRCNFTATAALDLLDENPFYDPRITMTRLKLALKTPTEDAELGRTVIAMLLLRSRYSHAMRLAIENP